VTSPVNLVYNIIFPLVTLAEKSLIFTLPAAKTAGIKGKINKTSVKYIFSYRIFLRPKSLKVQKTLAY